MRRCHLLAPLGAALVTLSALSGCGSDGAEVAPVSTGPVADGGAAVSELIARSACIEVAPSLRYDVAAGTSSPSGRTQVSTRAFDPMAGLISVQHQERDAADQPLPQRRSELTLRVQPDGSVALAQTIEHADEVITRFEPPMVVMPPVFRPGETLQQSFEMVVSPLDKPATVRTRGPCLQTLSHGGLERITTPAGTFDAVHVTSRVTGTLGDGLGKASIVIQTETWYAPGVGVVAQTQSERVTVFGLPVRSQAQRWLLKDRADDAVR
ncbi:MAG: TapB family protein [Phycisphaerales bacterium]